MIKSDIVIIGGVAVGPKTAATLARRNPDLKMTLLEKSKHISFATCGMPYFASGDVNSFNELTFTSYGLPRDVEFFKKSKGFDVITGAEVTRIDRENKFVEAETSDGQVKYQYDKLVIATGAKPKTPPFPVPESEKIISFTRPEDAIAFRKNAQTGQIGKAVIVGAGFIGCELAEAVGGMWGIETVLIEREDQLLPYVIDPEMSAMALRELKRNDVEVKTSCGVNKIELDDDNNPVVYLDGNETIKADFVFLCMGVLPEISLAKNAGLELGTTGAIKVNQHLQTNDSDIYAGGDCIESISIVSKKPIYIPMGSLANRHGRIIAENIIGNKTVFPKVTGAFLVKLYDINIGSVGMSQATAQKVGIETKSVWGAFPDKPDYYPESNSFSLKLTYASDEKLIGLQAVGKGDISRRIDTFSAILMNHGTIDDLLNFEHGYAPPFAEALDPLHHLASMAKANESGFEIISPANLDDDGSIWLDVREETEVKEKAIPEIENLKESRLYFNIPLNNLRDNIEQLDKEKNVKIICRRGPRSYQAAVILKSFGFEKVQIIGGGTKAAIS